MKPTRSAGEKSARDRLLPSTCVKTSSYALASNCRST